MKKVIKITESDLVRIIEKVISTKKQKNLSDETPEEIHQDEETGLIDNMLKLKKIQPYDQSKVKWSKPLDPFK